MPEDKELPAEQQGNENSQVSSPQHGIAKNEADAFLGHRNVDRFLALLEKKAEYDYEIDKEKNANEGKRNENAKYHLVTERYGNAGVRIIFVICFFVLLGYGMYANKDLVWGLIAAIIPGLGVIARAVFLHFANKQK